MPPCGSCASSPLNDWSERRLRQPRKFRHSADDWTQNIDRIGWDWESHRPGPDLRGIVKLRESVAVRFYRLAADWSENTAHVSSVDDLVAHPCYQEIINLGWDVVPLLLIDLQKNRRFWFPALYAITKVRPYDLSDAGNGRRMTDAWVTWGKRKKLI